MAYSRIIIMALFMAGVLGGMNTAWTEDTAVMEASSVIPEKLGGPKPSLVLGILEDSTAKRGGVTDLFKKEILDIVGKEYEVRFDQRQGDGTAEGIEKAFNTLLKEASVQLVVAADPLGSLIAVRRKELVKPVLAAQIFDAKALGLPLRDGHSGVKNLAYISRPNPLTEGMERLTALRSFNKPVLLVGTQWAAAVKRLNAASLLPKEMQAITVGEDPEQVIKMLPEGTDALCFGPLPNLTEEQFKALVAAVNARGFISWSLNGVSDVETGVFATLQPEGEMQRLARRTGISITRILAEGTPEMLPVDLESNPLLTLNLETARRIQLSVPWAVMDEAVVLNEYPQEVANSYTLESAVRRALTANLDLNEKERALRASAQNIPAARANLLPQVEAGTTYTTIDKELTSSYSPEKQWTASVKVSQLIYDEMAQANVAVQKRLQESLAHEYAGVELDIIKLAADSYFNVLYAKTLVDIQKSNLHQTRTYLDLARVRESAGASGMTEVYRWEAQIAQNRVEVTRAEAQWRAAQMQFNRVLNRAQDELFRLTPVVSEEGKLCIGMPMLADYLKDPGRFTKLISFLVATGVHESPELQQLDSAISARGRFYEATKRRYFIPTIGVQVEVKHQFGSWGEYSSPSGITSLIMPGVPEDSWTAGINASLPIYTGGKRKAEEIQARENLESLKYTRTSAAQKIEQRIRTAGEKIRASYSTIGQSRSAADAAQKNQELVAKGYGQGVLNITQLVDGQTAQLVAEQSAAGAVHGFMIDLMELYRSVGVAAFLESDEVREAWRTALETSGENP